MSGMFYITVVQALLLYRSNTRVVSPRIGKTLGGGSPSGDTETYGADATAE